MTSVNTQAQARTSVQAPQKTNDRPTVDQAIEEEIARYVRQGAADTLLTEKCAVDALCDKFNLRMSQAWDQWLMYATKRAAF